ncbi:hypothetical protein HXX76_010623 [Chlamydomonas incerta]|uniref:Uncharacterized protein n=1 Tax=Chlamydomonas incerta TaxID=51695 RepID=A0A835SQ98_CHLIN|nr:hypothetical protein HXX76_010623 [Chlamydomonas incerta]|eukprot:KAG2429841.1 hypothetical protein HXX76_010623 [Chlamydomonas incerta]
MLLQLQHRYATERERQEEAHKLQLQEQTDEHAKSLRELAAAHAAELAVAAKHLEREAAGRRADVQRLEALLSAARASVESSHGQLAAARAATEALQAQLQLQRATHEAELMHVRQVTVPLQQHDEMVAHLRAEWDAALKQRERDYTGLLQQLTELRQQMSSSGASSGGGARGGGSSGGTGPCGGTTGSAGAGGTGSSGDAPGSSVTAAPANGGDNAAGARPAQSGGSSCGENALQQLRHLRQRRPGPPQPDPEPPSTRAASSPDFLRQQQHPASPGAHSGCSSIDPADDLGTAVFELSEDTRRTAFRTATAAAMAAAAAAAPDVTPQSRGPMERPTSAGSISLGRMERLVDAVMRGPQDSSRQGAGASAGGGGWAAADQRWAEFGGAGAPTPCTGSPEGPNTSDATFGRWQAQQQAGSSPAATKGVGAGPRTARFSPDGVHAGRSGGRPSPRSTLACGAGAGSGGAASAATWGARSGNPAAMVSVLRCLRCGQNDVSSPGECRFHPALLPQPGSLVFSPEWLTCQAAGHTFATAGCLVRPQHFYEPRMLLAAQMQPPPAAAGQRIGAAGRGPALGEVVRLDLPVEVVGLPNVD